MELKIVTKTKNKIVYFIALKKQKRINFVTFRVNDWNKEIVTNGKRNA
jgi:hypothetical protein